MSLGMLGLYIIVARVRADTFCKIGVSLGPNDRLLSVQTGCPVPARLAATWRDRRLVILEAEREIQGLLHQQHSSGEWFLCSEQRAIEVAEGVLKRLTDRAIATQSTTQQHRILTPVCR